MDTKSQLLREADDALTRARLNLMGAELREPQVKLALEESTIATAKLNSLRLLLVGVPEPKVGG